ncbi:MAG: DUF92 domain-containing protein [Bacillus sp. (in: firmicutes)]
MIVNSLSIMIILWGSIEGCKMKLLTASGGAAAFLTGLFILLGMGWKGLLILGLFFASSSACSRYKASKKKAVDEIVQKGSARDWVQVTANGSVACLASLLYYFTGDNVWQVAFFIAIAASNSDTWASEIGVISTREPYYIWTLQRVPRGTSGAVSILGTTAAFCGSAFIALSAALLYGIASPWHILLVSFAGFSGSVIDTVLGASLQARYRCSNCGLQTEKTMHCGERTVLFKGFDWMTNDTVNVLSIFLATVFGLMILL